MRLRAWAFLGVAVGGAAFALGPSSGSKAVTSDELKPPVRLEAAGKPIDTDVGHAAPFYADFDGDGVRDLLVGQFGEGILRIYKNVGTDTRPKFAEGVKFKEGVKGGRVPTG